MKEALIFHLPFKRGPHTPPQMTLAVRKEEDGFYTAGFSVCSKNDSFVKRIGRARALARLRKQAYKFDDPNGLVVAIREHLNNLLDVRPEVVSNQTLSDLEVFPEKLEKMKVAEQ